MKAPRHIQLLAQTRAVRGSTDQVSQHIIPLSGDEGEGDFKAMETVEGLIRWILLDSLNWDKNK